MMRLLQSCLFRFAEQGKGPKGVTHYLKTKKAEAVADALPNGTPLQDLQGAHRLLYIQFLPPFVMAFPVIYFLSDPTNYIFNASLNLLQYYLSGVLCFNSFFTQSSQHKYYYILGAISAVNCITGPYSMAVPVLLGLLNMYAPFTDEKYHKFETVEHEEKVKTYLKVQGLFYFLVGALLTLKFYHYEEIRQLQMKLAKFEEENKVYYQLARKDTLI